MTATGPHRWHNIGEGAGSLRTVIGQAQGMLLDRRVPPPAEDAFSVEIVTWDEWSLLAAYRALPPGTQQGVLGELAQLQ